MPKQIDSIELPHGLRTLTPDQLRSVADELRDELIDTVASAGGHFASSLGATELTVVLHHLFNTPEDRIIWDVGHQAYVHKMVTGRRDGLAKIRKSGGISGFLKRCESEYDCFGAGHAGTSISAAVGMRVAQERQNPDKFTIAVIGDGSMTSGMAFEALNHAGALGLKNFIVVLNDNEMSISPNVGALSWLFSMAVTSRTSTRAREGIKNLYKRGYVPQLLYKALDRAEEAAQGFFASPAMLFEAFGFRYIGPVDGHNIGDLLSALKNAREQGVPVVVHAITQKGKGYAPAEEDPVRWHGVNPFNRTRGEFIKSGVTSLPPTYTAVFADTMIELAQADDRIIAITAAMPGGTGLDKFAKALPEQCFDVGICEQHAVTFAAGLACEGYRPVCAIYSTFLQRAYDQVVHDVCIQKLPVVLAMDRAGVVGNDGETHQGVFDIAYLRTLPGMVIMSPRDENELRHMVHSSLEYKCPVAIRYPRGEGIGVELDRDFKLLELGKAEVIQRGQDVLLVAFGPLVNTALEVAERLERERGVSVTVINARFAKPLDEKLFADELPRYQAIATLEDHALQGGFGSAVLEFIDARKLSLRGSITRFGIGDEFVAHASQIEQHKAAGLDAESIFHFLAKQVTPLKVIGSPAQAHV